MADQSCAVRSGERLCLDLSSTEDRLERVTNQIASFVSRLTGGCAEISKPGQPARDVGAVTVSPQGFLAAVRTLMDRQETSLARLEALATQLDEAV